MYEAFYGLKEKPFNLLPDPEYLFMSKSHDNAYAHLEYAISENKGFVVVTGEIGSGKTTLLNFLLNKISQDINVGLINNTSIPPDQLLKVICREFELSVDGRDKAQLLSLFQDFLVGQFSSNHRVVLFVDEAQNLSPAALEEVRLLSNLETEKSHLIQIILVGQPELRFRLQRNDLKQFAQRVSVHCHLKGLNNGEVQQYIKHRLKAAGAKKIDIFRKDSVDLIAEYSKGIPRLINILCDTSLVYGFADGQKLISRKIVSSVIDAREAGGILTEGVGGGSEKPVVMAEKPDTGGSVIDYEPWIQSLERRLLVLENMTVSMDQKITQLSQKKEDRDMVVLELFKMLRESIENRLSLVAKFNQLRKQIDFRKKTPPIGQPVKVVPKGAKKVSRKKIFLWSLSAVTLVLIFLIILDQLILPIK